MKMLTKDQMIQIMGGVVDWEEEEGAQVCDCNSNDDCPSDKRYCVVCQDSKTQMHGHCQATISVG